MVKRKSEDDIFFDAKSTLKELQQSLKKTSDSELQVIYKQSFPDKDITPEEKKDEKKDESKKKSLIRKIAERGGGVLILGGSFYGLNKVQEMNDEYGAENLGHLGSLMVTISIKYFQKYLRATYGLYANAGSLISRVFRGETLEQATTNEAFIASVHLYFENWAQANEAIRATLPAAGGFVGGLAGGLVGLPVIGGSLGATGGAGLSYLMSRAFFETIQDDVDVTDLTRTAGRLYGRLQQIVSASSSTAGYYLLPSQDDLYNFLNQIINTYLEVHYQLYEK